MISLYTKFEVCIFTQDRDFKFGVQTDHGKQCQMDDKTPQGGRDQGHITMF